MPSARLAGVDRPISEAKERVERLRAELHAGRGGVLAEDAGPEGAAAVGTLRRKWRTLLAGLNIASDAAGGEHAAADGHGTGGHTGGGNTGGGNGVSGSGGQAGGGAGSGYTRGPAMSGSREIDAARYAQIAAALKDRGNQQGQAWDRSGAQGPVCARVETDRGCAAGVDPRADCPTRAICSK